LAVQSGLSRSVTFGIPPFAGVFEFAIAGGPDLLVSARQVDLWG
jgi:hypothetical protein